MRLPIALLCLALVGCGASPAREDDAPPQWVLACAGGAAGPMGLVGGKCAVRKAGDAACVIDPVAMILYAVAGCAGAAAAVHVLGPGEAPTESPWRVPADSGVRP